MQTEDKSFEVEHKTDEQTIQVEIKLSSNNKSKLENICKNLYSYAQTKLMNISKYEKLNKKTATITTRKSPCGEGTNTWARYKLHVYWRSFDIEAGQSALAKVAEFLTNSDVEITLTIKK
ncbi:hypothetical protein BDAP_000505 [Binucleata daphniae]